MKSVFVINGFLDSGKTQFISYTLSQPYFKTKGTTLLIVCEEGEEEYDERMLKQTNTEMVVVDDISDVSADKLIELDKKYKPSRVVIEWNGMWSFKEFKLPFLWKLEQQLSLIDCKTFELYYNNMRAQMGDMVRNSELIIFNRCDNMNDKVSGYKRNIKALNQKAEVVFEDKDGEINATLEEELPYDLSKSRIDLNDETYGIWYLDMLDNLERYIGKEVSYTANVYIPDNFIPGYFVPGRAIMTCCAEDIQFLGFVAKYDKVSELKNKSWAKVVCRVEEEFFKGYEGKGPVLKPLSIEPCKAPKNEILTF